MRSAVTVLLLCAAGCARDTGAFPSLAERPAERRGFAEPSAPPPEVARPDPALDARIAALTGRVRGVATGFDRDAARAETAVRATRGRPVGSEPWLEAQTALAQLDDWRAQASEIVTDVEQLTGERAATLLPPYPSLEAAQRAAEAEADRQGAAIARLSATLPSA